MHVGKPGLRELKKQRTRAAISNAAIALFLERGFDQVSVAQVAEAAEVSKRTLFAYFPSKEDLVVQRLADHETEAARVVRSRSPGIAPLAALREHFLRGLRDREPVTGLSDRPHVRRINRMILDTPSLVARMERFKNGAERSLAEALRDTTDVADLTARLAAVQIVGVQWALARDNADRLATGGQTADTRYPGAVADAEHAFVLLEHGLAQELGDEPERTSQHWPAPVATPESGPDTTPGPRPGTMPEPGLPESGLPEPGLPESGLPDR